jgi:hypothetical protein
MLQPDRGCDESSEVLQAEDRLTQWLQFFSSPQPNPLPKGEGAN